MPHLSNVPAPYIGFNLRALCQLPKKSLLQKVLGGDYSPMPLRKSCGYAMRVLNQRFNFNMLLFVSEPELWKFADDMVEHHDLPITQKFFVETWDMYVPVRAAYTIERILWYGDCQLQTEEVLVAEEEDDNAWFSFIDLLAGD